MKEAQRMEHSERYLEILKYVKEGVYFVDTSRTITFWNDWAENITGFSAPEVIGRHCYANILNHIDEKGTHLCIGGCPLHRTMEDGQERTASVFLHHKDGNRVAVNVRTFPVYEKGTCLGAVELFSQEKPVPQLAGDLITIEDLRVLAMTDQLTGLGNRRFIESALSEKLTQLKEFKTGFGVAMVDIDHFKTVNDTYGHNIGDLALQTISRSLENALGSDDRIGRWGGEEFLVLINSEEAASIVQTIERMRILVEHSSVKRGTLDRVCTVSIGAVLVQRPMEKETIIQAADQLMYESKQKGRNQTHFATLP